MITCNGRTDAKTIRTKLKLLHDEYALAANHLRLTGAIPEAAVIYANRIKEANDLLGELLPDLIAAFSETPAAKVTEMAEAGDYLISLYERLWKGAGPVRDLAEASGSWKQAKLAVSLTAGVKEFS